jgi:four helix bundle protein
MASEPVITSYRDLRVWQDSMDLAVLCYQMTGRFPREEMFGLTTQIRRAASSIPANVAEGHGRESTASFVQYLRVAQGSLKELETHLLLATRLGYLEASVSETTLGRCGELGRMLRSLIRSLQKKNAGS